MNSRKTGLILLAAGSSRRMQSSKNKVLLNFSGKPLFLHALMRFAEAGVIDEAVIVCRPDERSEIKPYLAGLPFPCVLTDGGTERQDSVLNGLNALSASIKFVMIHDSARPYISHTTIKACYLALQTHGSAVVGVFVTDTIKRVETDRIVQTLDRTHLVGIQTPQCFTKETLLAAHKAAKAEGYIGTDDSVLVERLGLPVHFVEGEYTNIKVTTPADMPEKGASMRIGHGMDVHAFTDGRKLILGGVTLPYTKGLAGHSDADVLVHAVMDALLGAAGLPDIGQLFPDTDPAYKDANSLTLLKAVGEKLAEKSLTIGNIDATLALQAPKVAPYLTDMKKNIADALSVSPDKVNIKATTTEHLGFVGREEGVVCHTVCLVLFP